MRTMLILAVPLAFLCGGETSAAAPAPAYAWRSPQDAAASGTLEQRIPPPPGFTRVAATPESWATWLRGLPLKPAGALVLTYTGVPKLRQDVHVAVSDIDVGSRDLQPCADAIMRLRGEWLFSAGRGRLQRYGQQAPHVLRARQVGSRRLPQIHGPRVCLRRHVLAKARAKPTPLADIQIGDVFVKGGFPGHAVLVADMAENAQTGEKRFLLVQSYMPAQEMHVLKNPAAPDGSPWYPAAFTGNLVTPEWTFAPGALHRWP
jgi:Domain of unknown function (4846)